MAKLIFNFREATSVAANRVAASMAEKYKQRRRDRLNRLRAKLQATVNAGRRI